MNWTENKIEISVVGATALIIGLFLILSQAKPGTRSKFQEEVSYEMPRARSSFAPEFDLTNREILRNYIGQMAQKNRTLPPQPRSKPTLLSQAKKNEQKKATAAKSASKKPSMTVDIVNDETDTSKLALEPNDETDFSNPPTGLDALPKPRERGKVPKAKTEKSDKDWKAAFLANPSQALIAELVRAYKERQVSDTLYYSILKDLILSQNEVNQSFGLYGLRSFNSVRSFTEAVHWSLIPEVQKKASLESSIQSYMMSFNQKSRLPLLDAALKTQMPEVVLKASQVVFDGLAKVRAGESFGSERDQRNLAAASLLTAYQRFIPTFEGLRKSADPEISRAAMTLLEQLQTVKIAQN